MPSSETTGSDDGPRILTRQSDGAAIACLAVEGAAPTVVFLPGFRSDMAGTKALALDAGCRARGQAFLRFDYTGHGRSSGRLIDGTIGQWAADAIFAVEQATEGPLVLVGSSMGGWIMLLVALARPRRVAGLVGVAAAPDFTETLMWRNFKPEIRAALERDGVYHEPSDYGEEPYAITMDLIVEGRKHLLMDRSIPITCPVRLIHGTADPDVPWKLSLELMEQLESADVEVTLVKGGGHRLSEPEDLERLNRAVAGLSEQLA